MKVEKLSLLNGLVPLHNLLSSVSYFSWQNDNFVTAREWQLKDNVAPTAFLVSLTTTCPHSPPTAKLCVPGCHTTCFGECRRGDVSEKNEITNINLDMQVQIEAYTLCQGTANHFSAKTWFFSKNWVSCWKKIKHINKPWIG